MRRQVNNLISVAFTAIRIFIYKIIRGRSFKVNLIERISLNVYREFNNGSFIRKCS